jgi:single-strand DNA-binding protein
MAREAAQTIIGNIGQVPEMKNKAGETPFCVFTVAVDRIPRKQGDKPPPLWYRVSLWGRNAETAVRLGYKGAPVYVAGDFDVSDWTDREGKPRYTLEVAGSKFQMLGESPTSQSAKVEEALVADRQTRPAAPAGAAAGSKKGLGEGY